MVTWRHTSLKFQACESGHLSQHLLNITKLMIGRSKGNKRKLRLEEDLCYQLAWSFPFLRALVVFQVVDTTSQALAILMRLRPRLHVSGYFWTLNFFFPDSKISTCTRIQIHSSTQDFSGNIGNRPCVVKTGKRENLGTRLPSWIQYSGLDLVTSPDKKKWQDLASTRFRIHSVFINFHAGERIKKVADSYAELTGYVWTEAVSGKKKLRIQKYPADACGQSRPESSAELSAVPYYLNYETIS